jgi:hypothetical protein
MVSPGDIPCKNSSLQGISFFFDEEWNNRVIKNELVQDLSRITRIETEILLHTQSLSSVAVAQKMSWASNRRTTRVKDTAYCLLGNFNVNMPLLYGEEEKAFRRLQDELSNLPRTLVYSLGERHLVQRKAKNVEDAFSAAS